MPSLPKYLNQLKVTATSPDGEIKMSLDFQNRVKCGFRNEAAFRSYDASKLAHQLTVVLDSARDALRRGVRKAYEAAGYTVEPDQPHWDAERRRFRAAVAKTQVTGKSRNGLVLLRASAARDSHRVRIHPKALEQLNREQFLAELHSAYASLLTEAKVKRNELRKAMLPS